MIFLLMLLVACPLFADTLAENQARVGVITGDVGLLSQGAADWIEPHEGLPLEPGDRIRTGEDGHVEIVAGENELWMLEPQTELVTEHMETNTGRFSLTSGTLLGRVDSERTAGIAQHWEFNTPAAVVTIRGTEFAITFSTTGGSHLGVFEGTVDMEQAETAEGMKPPVQVSAGQEAVARRGKSIVTLPKFSSPIFKLSLERPLLRKRQATIQNTWSPFTPEVRAEARKKFVGPPVKRRPLPHPTRVKHVVSPS